MALYIRRLYENPVALIKVHIVHIGVKLLFPSITQLSNYSQQHSGEELDRYSRGSSFGGFMVRTNYLGVNNLYKE